MRASPPISTFVPGGGAQRALPWLQVLRLPGLRDPQAVARRKAFTPQPGECAGIMHRCGVLPGRAALTRATGPQSAEVV
ncbi:hypothetical protein [Klebsiella michiganensis]|uniref:hypothetical protein n=1 Tax=Klebsiella michiganensis TaxID=1134687 RepID=UPI0011E55AC6|nr:hypothetical protein [Klebsiella michiganensis]